MFIDQHDLLISDGLRKKSTKFFIIDFVVQVFLPFTDMKSVYEY